ncbi:MAG: protein TolQ [bacterium]
MSIDMTFLHLILDASIVVKLVMLILLFLSLASWTLIVIKAKVLGRAKAEAEAFEEKFWSGADLDKLYQGVSREANVHGLERIFASGYKEYARQSKVKNHSMLSSLDIVTRSMRVTLSREVDRLESSLSFLATVGSTSPYIGLFGTVWGIMHSFMALSDSHANTLSAVAPGIAEALIATAIGLFAAIPAVIAYNRFADNVERLVTQYDNFVEEFTTLLQRHAAGNS